MRGKRFNFHIKIASGIFPLIGAQIPYELFAGLILALATIPEVMAYAKIAGLPPVYGLYSVFLPPILFALFTSSKHMVVGLDAVPAAIIAS